MSEYDPPRIGMVSISRSTRRHVLRGGAALGLGVAGGALLQARVGAQATPETGTTSTDGGGPGNTSDAATSSLPGRFVAVGVVPARPAGDDLHALERAGNDLALGRGAARAAR